MQARRRQRTPATAAEGRATTAPHRLPAGARPRPLSRRRPALTRRARELRLLYDLTAAAEGGDLDHTLEIISARVRLLPHTDQVTVLVRDEGTSFLAGRTTTARLDLAGVRLPAVTGSDRLLEGPVVVNDPARVAPGLRALMAAGSRSLLCLPLAGGGEQLGLLVLGSRSPRAYRADQVRALLPLLDRVTDRVAAHLLLHRRSRQLQASARHASLAETRRQQRRVLHREILAGCSRALQGDTATDGDVIGEIAEAVAHQVGDGCAILVADDGLFRPAAVADQDPERGHRWRTLLLDDPIGVGEGTSGLVLRTSRPVVIERFDPGDLHGTPPAWAPFVAGLAGQGLALLPLRARERAFGVLVAHRRSPYREDELGFLGELAERLALALLDAELETGRTGAMLDLRAGRERFRLALEGMLDPVALCAPVREADGMVSGFRITFVNSAHRAAGGLPPGIVLRPGQCPPQWAEIPASLGQVWDSGRPLHLDRVPYGPTGDLRYAEGNAVRVGQEVLFSWKEITDRLRSEEELAATAERLRLAFDEAPIAAALVSLEPGHIGEFTQVNHALGVITGYPAEQLCGAHGRLLSHPDDQAEDERHLHELANGSLKHYQRERRLLRADGRVIWARVTVAAVGRDGGPRYAVKHVEDVTARRSADEELTRRALYDPLTGLPNRHLLMDHLALAVQQLPRRGGAVGVLYLDVDRFKQINDTYGHEAGDDVIRQVGSRLSATVRGPDTAARLAGDEFVVVGHLQAEADGPRFAERIQAALQAPVRSGTTDIPLGASIGVATAHAPTVTPQELLRRADLAMYDAKRRGSGQSVVFDAARHDTTLLRGTLELQLRAALAEGNLRLHYQPIVDVRDRRIVAAEALLRIQDADGRLLPPQEFIDVAEDSDLIMLVGEWVLGRAAAQAAEWHRIDPALEIAVNVSGRQASRLAVSEQVLRATDSAGVDPSGLSIEITENALIDGGSSVIEDLTRLTDLGVRLALDDFGTGYSSLTYLRNLPVDTVKIDRSFVAGLGRHAGDTAIVEAVTALGRALGLRTVAEGVETQEQLSALRSMGCSHAQGFWLGRPMPAEAVTPLLRG